MENFRDFTIYKDYIYTISKQDQVLARVDKNDFNSVSVVSYVEESGSISGVEVYSTLSQKNKPEHPCNQHNCQKFCFTISDSNSGFKATCGCPYGEKLAKDGRTCEDNQNEEPRFVPCQSSSYLCDRKTEKIESWSFFKWFLDFRIFYTFFYNEEYVKKKILYLSHLIKNITNNLNIFECFCVSNNVIVQVFWRSYT